MRTTSSDVLLVQSSDDVVRVRQKTRALAIAAGFNIVEQTKVVTASSEIARNTLIHGGGGEVLVEVVDDSGRVGVRLVFSDTGPGIPDIALAMKDGYTTAGGMGHGLGGAKRLTHEFQVDSTPGEGTRVMILRWKGF